MHIIEVLKPGGGYHMIIVFVIDNYGELSNGTTMTAKRTKEMLEKRGHTVRIVSAGPIIGEGYYQLKKRWIPIVSEVSAKQHMYFAKFDRKVMEKAFEGADIVHFFLPFSVSIKGIKLAKKMGIPATAAFHTQPENVTWGIGVGPAGTLLADCIYYRFRRRMYRRVSRVHCPTEFIAGELKRHNYRNILHVISNGIGPAFHLEETEKSKGKFEILSIGRYAPEKRQEIILKAIFVSGHKNDIHLTLAGTGPKENKLRKIARKLDIDTTFDFYSTSDLIKVIHKSDLYVHAAEAEIEGISCLEAFASGVTPVIATAKKSATAQFALDDRSLFKGGNYKELAKKIDYWIENPDELEKADHLYAESAEKYNLQLSCDLFEEMLKQAVEDKIRENAASTEAGRKISKRVKFSPLKKVLSAAFYYLIAVPLLSIYIYFVRGVRIRNRRQLRKIKGGAVLISNHVHTLDSAMNGIAAFPRKPVFTGLRANFELPVAGFFVNILGTVPVPETYDETKIFFYELTKQLRKGKLVHFFPEGELIKYDTDLRPFKKGAFHIAEEAEVPIVPIGISFHEKTSIFPLLSPNKVVLTVGDPIYPDAFKRKREAIDSLFEESQDAMEKLIKA